MRVLVAFGVFILTFQYSHACNLFETKRTCECTAWFTVGNSVPKKLFDVLGYDDCGANLGCQLAQNCAQFCTRRIRFMLAGRDDLLDVAGQNKLCQLVEYGNQNIVRPGIKLTAEWKYSTCLLGSEVIAQDVCCNKKCSCKLSGQYVTPFSTNTNLQLVDFSPNIPNTDISYNCMLSEIDDCEKHCLSQISKYFNNPLLEKPDPEKVNWNLFTSEFESQKICQAIGTKVNRPGIDIYVRIDSETQQKRIFNLGRVCCANQCKCEYKFYLADNGREIGQYTPVTISKPLNIGYECSEELSDCMTYCRRNAVSSVTAITPSYEQNKTLHLNDFLGYLPYATSLCQSIKYNTGNSGPGINVYLRCTNNIKATNEENEKIPLTEELHLGRICCRSTEYIPSNRCV